MIIDNRIIFGYATVVYGFGCYNLNLKNVGLHKYKIGEKIANEKIPDIIIKLDTKDYFDLKEKLKSNEDIIEFKSYILDFSKGGGRESKQLVLISLEKYISQWIQPCLAC